MKMTKVTAAAAAAAVAFAAAVAVSGTATADTGNAGGVPAHADVVVGELDDVVVQGDIGVQDASGSFRGSPSQVRLNIKGSGLRVDSIKIDYGWTGGTGSVNGHAEVYNTSTGLIWNTPNKLNGGGNNRTSDSKSINKSYPDGSKICAVWWTKLPSGWHKNVAESCLNIHD